MTPELHIFGGGTFSHVRNHLSLAAPAFGESARDMFLYSVRKYPEILTKIHLTKMADPACSSIETNEDLMAEIITTIKNPSVKGIIFSAAVCDYKGTVLDSRTHLPTKSGKTSERLKTSEVEHPVMMLEANDKIVRAIKPIRTDIKLATFKTTCGASDEEMVAAAATQLQSAGAEIVLVNDILHRVNITYTPVVHLRHENRYEALQRLVDTVNEGIKSLF